MCSQMLRRALIKVDSLSLAETSTHAVLLPHVQTSTHRPSCTPKTHLCQQKAGRYVSICIALSTAMQHCQNAHPHVCSPAANIIQPELLLQTHLFGAVLHLQFTIVAKHVGRFGMKLSCLYVAEKWKVLSCGIFKNKPQEAQRSSSRERTCGNMGSEAGIIAFENVLNPRLQNLST